MQTVGMEGYLAAAQRLHALKEKLERAVEDAAHHAVARVAADSLGVPASCAGRRGPARGPPRPRAACDTAGAAARACEGASEGALFLTGGRPVVRHGSALALSATVLAALAIVAVVHRSQVRDPCRPSASSLPPPPRRACWRRHGCEMAMAGTCAALRRARAASSWKGTAADSTADGCTTITTRVTRR